MTSRVEGGRQTIRPDVLADVLRSEFIGNKDANRRFNLTSDWDQSSRFEDMVIIHKLSLVLLALLSAEKECPSFKAVREHIENLVFSPNMEEGMPFFLEVKRGIDKLAELFQARDNAAQWMRWATSWLSEVGIDETNPARLFQFATMWTDNYVTLSDYLKGYVPL